MNKVEFLRQLDMALKRMPENERKEILSDYEEHFAYGLTDGKSEEDICKKLGNPQSIAKELLADYSVTKAEETKSFHNISRAVFATISLSLFNLIVVLGPAVALLSVLFSIGAFALSALITPFILVFGFFVNGLTAPLFELSTVIALFGFGLLLSVGTVKLGQFFGNILVKYIKFNLSIIKGRDSK